MYYRLSLLSFLVYAIPGAWIPVFSLRLEKELHFAPRETAMAFGSWAVGTLVASMIAGQVADRWFSLEKCIAFCATVVGTLMYFLSQATTPWTVIPLCVLMCLFLAPTLTLCLTYCLTHLDNPERQFGRVRLWGTVGWVTPGLLLYVWYSQPPWLAPLLSQLGSESRSFADAQRLSSVIAFCLAGYALTLPHAPPPRHGRSWLAPLEALPLLKRRSFAVFCLCLFLLHITVPFNFQQIGLLLDHLGIEQRWIPLLLTIAQCSEIVVLFFLPVFSPRLGMRYTLLLGLTAWVLALTILSIGQPTWLVIGSLVLNAFTICCYMIRGQMFVARQAGPSIRASAQGLFAMTSGIGGVLGNLLVGWVREAVAKDFTISFAVGAGLASLALLVFAVGFRETETPVISTPAETVELQDSVTQQMAVENS